MSIQFVGSSIVDPLRLSILIWIQFSIGLSSSKLKRPATFNSLLYSLAFSLTSFMYSVMACILLLFASFSSKLIEMNLLTMEYFVASVWSISVSLAKMPCPNVSFRTKVSIIGQKIRASWIGVSATLSISFSSMFDLSSIIASEWMCTSTAEVLVVEISLLDSLSTITLGHTIVVEESKLAFWSERQELTSDWFPLLDSLSNCIVGRIPILEKSPSLFFARFWEASLITEALMSSLSAIVAETDIGFTNTNSSSKLVSLVLTASSCIRHSSSLEMMDFSILGLVASIR